MTDLADLRARLDDIDQELVDLISRRLETSRRWARPRRSPRTRCATPARERAVLESVEAAARREIELNRLDFPTAAARDPRPDTASSSP